MQIQEELPTTVDRDQVKHLEFMNKQMEESQKVEGAKSFAKRLFLQKSKKPKRARSLNMTL